MYAVIESGGKQYRVEVGTELEVELLDVEPGQSVTLDRVLLVADGDEAAIGRPVVADAAVEAEVVRQDRADKVIVFKYRPKARRRVKKGHRQDLTVLRITDVRFNGKSAADSARKAEQDAKTERQRLEEAAAKQAAADAALAAKLAKASPEGASEAKAAKPSTRTRPKAADAEAEAPAKPKARAKTADTGEATEAAGPAAAATEPSVAETVEATDAPETPDTPDTEAAPRRSRAKKDE